MASYTTIDTILDLGSAEMSSAIELTMEPTENDPKYDVIGMAVGVDAAPFNPAYKFTAAEGAVYSVIDISYFDPYLRLYDSSGNAIQTNSESLDSSAEIIFYDQLHMSDGGVYALDILLEWTAPYTGTYYLKPGWEQGSYYKNYSIVVSGDTDSAITPPPPSPPPEPPVISDIDRVYNWAENAYLDLFPEHRDSQSEVFGYYARMYSNGDALGEKNGSIYYYDGGAGGSGEITLVGTIGDFLPQATAAGF